MKNFNINVWNWCLAEQNREVLGETEDVDFMATTLSNNVNSALGVCALVKTFRIRPAFIPGLQPETKSVMELRDKARREINPPLVKKLILLEKYRKLRKEATTLIKKDRLAENSRKVDDANNESLFLGF